MFWFATRFALNFRAANVEMGKRKVRKSNEEFPLLVFSKQPARFISKVSDNPRARKTFPSTVVDIGFLFKRKGSWLFSSNRLSILI